MSMLCRQDFYVHPAYRHGLEREGIVSPEALYAFCGRGTLVSQSSSSKVWKNELPEGGIYVKKYEYQPPSFRYWGRQSRGLREFLSYQAFVRMNLHCPDIVCFGEQRSLGRLCWSIIATQEIANACDLYQFFRNRTEPSYRALRLQMMQKLGMLVSTLHRHHFFHHDLKLRNVLWQENHGPDSILYLIDCPRGQYRRCNRSRAALFDLVSIYEHARQVCHPEEWQVLLQQYAEENGMVSPDLVQKVTNLGTHRFGLPS